MAFDEQFPHIVCCTKVNAGTRGSKRLDEDNLFDIKFFQASETTQYFAIAGTSQIIICRTHEGQEPPFDILHWLNAKHENASQNSICWTTDEDDRPLVCTAGSQPRHITVYDVQTGTSIKTLPGHGRSINDLAISPKNKHLLASASEDFSIRLWSLHPAYRDQPCIAILAGDGHRQPILTCSFHRSGDWLISGGMDTAVALWAVPELPSERAKIQEPEVIFRPHFYSAEVHSNLVDCITFYNDLIISRCSRKQRERDEENENEILIWSIDGFNGEPATTCKAAPASSPDKYTRSAFSSDPLALGFKRLVTLDMPETDRFYLRFGLYHAHNHRPMLCMGNQLSKLCFWDLQRLEEELFQSAKKNDGSAGGLRATVQEVSHDPFKAVKAHHVVPITSEIMDRKLYTSSAATWSPDGRWLISVGGFGVMVMMNRG